MAFTPVLATVIVLPSADRLIPLTSVRAPAFLNGDRVVVLARGRRGQRARLEGQFRPGWCWLQSRFVIIGMAVAAEPGGGTRVALTGGIRVPGRAAIVPVRVRQESTKTMDRLERLMRA